MLLEKLKKDRQMAAKESKVKRSILTTLLGEAENVAKREQTSVTDDLIVKLAKKFIAANKETLKVKDSNVLKEENGYLSEYLPVQMSESEIRTAIERSDQTTMGGIMGYLSKNFKGKFDGKIANKLARDFI